MTNEKRGPDAEGKGATEEPTPDEFRSFLVALATDAIELGAFLKDPDAAMKAAGISDVDQAILKSGQSAAIHARLSGQKFSFAPSSPVTVLVVDMVRPAGSQTGSEQPVVRNPFAYATQQTQGSAIMFQNLLQMLPQIHPQVYPPIFPQVSPIFPPPVHPVITQWPPVFPPPPPVITQWPPQFPHIPPIFSHWPPVFPTVPPIFPPPVFPQVHPVFPQVHPVFPQVHPQVVVHPQIFPQVHPQVVVHPQIYPQVHPQLVFPPFPGAIG